MLDPKSKCDSLLEVVGKVKFVANWQACDLIPVCSKILKKCTAG
jgi:hypothetical protein